MTQRTTLISAGARWGVSLGVLAAGVGGFFLIGTMGEPVPKRPASGPTEVAVETAPVEVCEDGLDIEVDGHVVPTREMEISADVPGRVVQKSDQCRPGKYVTKGMLLATIDPSNYELDIQRLGNDLERTEHRLDELEVELANTDALIELAKQQLQLHLEETRRILQLVEKRAASGSEVDLAKRQELQAKDALQTYINRLQLRRAGRAQLEDESDSVEAQLEKARLQLRRTKIEAPIDGVIVSTDFELNSYVQTGSLLFVIEDTSSVEVECDLQVTQLSWIWSRGHEKRNSNGEASPGDNYSLPPVPVTVGYQLNGHEYSWQGVLSRYQGIGLDERTRTVPCRIVVGEPCDVSVEEAAPSAARAKAPPALVRGMFVTARIHVKPTVALLQMPQRAVQPGNVVWRVEEGAARRIPITVAKLLEDCALVQADASGIASGDRVVISSVDGLSDGTPVQEKGPK